MASLFLLYTKNKRNKTPLKRPAFDFSSIYHLAIIIQDYCATWVFLGLWVHCTFNRSYDSNFKIDVFILSSKEETDIVYCLDVALIGAIKNGAFDPHSNMQAWLT